MVTQSRRTANTLNIALNGLTLLSGEWLNSVRKRSLSLAIVRTYNFVTGNASISAYLTILLLHWVTHPPTVTRPTFKSFTWVGFCLHLSPPELCPIRSA